MYSPLRRPLENEESLYERVENFPLFRPFGYPDRGGKRIILCCHIDSLLQAINDIDSELLYHQCNGIVLMDGNERNIPDAVLLKRKNGLSFQLPLFCLELAEEELKEYDILVYAPSWLHYLKGTRTMLAKDIRFHYVFAPSFRIPQLMKSIPDYLERNYLKLKEVFDLLMDEESKQVFIGRIKATLNGDVGYLYLTHYKEYFHPEVCPRPGDILIDGGVGSYVYQQISFSETVGEQGRIVAFEPDPESFKVALETFQRRNCHNLLLLPYGLWDDLGELPFISAGLASHVCLEVLNSEGSITTIKAKMVTIDHMVSKLKLPKVDFIKLDVEGSELQALRGGIKTILDFRPRMAICLYHRPEHLWEIPLFLKGLDVGYKFFLGHSHALPEHTVLYCAP